ncbi:MAG: DUF2336 domain-containing protein [Pseudolabrys sp.]|nr:DUF2336 domain-containing protein [Pseudolabrys sp.]
MIVRQFLHWLRKAAPGERADATSALARAYLYSDLSPDDLAAAEGAMVMLLDDPSPLVRRALAEVFAGTQMAPPVIVHALAQDQADVATPVLERSPLLGDSELIDLLASDSPAIQTAIASRTVVSRALAAAIAEVGAPPSCLALLENDGAEITLASIDRIVARFGDVASIRENLLARPDLPPPTRQALLAKLSESLAGFVSSRQWLGEDHAQCAAKQACEKATIALAAETPYGAMAGLVAHLRESGQLTAGLILRALLSGNIVLVEEALAELSGLDIARVTDFIHDKNVSAFRALYKKAGLPDAAYPAFREALAALRQGMLVGEQGGVARLKRGMVEWVLARCAAQSEADIEPVITLLRRYAVEAAREEARMFCQDLIADDRQQAPRLVA